MKRAALAMAEAQAAKVRTRENLAEALARAEQQLVLWCWFSSRQTPLTTL